MPWQVPVVLRIFFAHVVGQYLLKRVSGLPSRTRRLTWQFFFAAIFALLFALATRTPLNHPWLLLIVALGAVNSFGTYCQWRAIAISQSKTALFTWADDLIAMALAYALLSEAKFLTLQLTSGALLCLGATLAFPFATSSSAVKKNDARRAQRALIGWVACYSVIWGLAAFAQRAFSLGGVSLPAFIASWYGGAFFGALGVKAFAGAKESGGALSAKGIAGTAILAFSIWVAMILAYWQRQLAPIAVVQPIQQVSEMMLPAFIGLFVFKEARELNRRQWLLFAVALAGGLVIAFSFR